MPTFVILSRLSPEAFDDPEDFKDLAKDVSEKIKQECPGVTWPLTTTESGSDYFKRYEREFL